MKIILKKLQHKAYIFISKLPIYWLKLKYIKIPRFVEVKNIKISVFNFDVPDFPSVYEQIKSILYSHDFNFPTKDKDICIYDCGANVGVITCYLSKLYPNAKIKAFEPDTNITKYLKININKNITNKNNIEIVEKCVWIHNDGVSFQAEGADGGSLTHKVNKNIVTKELPSVRLKDLISKEKKVNFLKMDIEGAEKEVLKDIESELYKVQYLLFEYHLINNEPNDLSNLLALLERNGFYYSIKTEGVNNAFTRKGFFNIWKSPDINHPFALQLLISAVNKGM